MTLVKMKDPDGSIIKDHLKDSRTGMISVVNDHALQEYHRKREEILKRKEFETRINSLEKSVLETNNKMDEILELLQNISNK